MEYDEAADYLQSLQLRRPKLGTETTAAMLSYLGDPQSDIDCVQIGGSNGKGSTARMLDSVLQREGIDVGLFTSPNLNDFREQIRVNGRKVPRERVCQYVEEIEPCVELLGEADDEPTHFEVLTAIAIRHFAAEAVDVAILEVGIGGRYDATSAVDPVASAITSVSLEHTELLGDTVEEIALDKVQIAPDDRPLVTGADGAALEAIRTETDVVTVGPADADVIATERGITSTVESQVSIESPDWSIETRIPLLGQYQATNAGVAGVLARQVAGVEPRTIAEGLRNAHWPGRFEVMCTDPMIVLDGSHNPGACAKLADLVDRFEFDDLHLVFGAMSDKDHDRMAAELPAVDSAYLCRPAVDRAASVDDLADAFAETADRIQRYDAVLEATERAIEGAGADDFVLVTGSLYAVAEARDRWTRLVAPKQVSLPEANEVVSERPVARSSHGSVADDIDYEVLETYLRRGQAERLEERVEAAGGQCVLSEAGVPGKYVAVLIGGTVSQLRTACEAVATDGHGLEHVARQLTGQVTSDDRSGRFPGVDGTAVMGILNVTPDSFYDGGEYERLDDAVDRARRMVEAGADVIDVGGESTRPGADPVPVSEEIDRVVPVIEAVSDLGVPVSVDTRKAPVADAALEAGADIVNDVSGLEDPEMRFVVADHDASLVLMHSLDAPVDPDRVGGYDDVVEDVLYELSEQVLLAERAGIDREQIIVDPGCGFGKDAAESFELVERLHEFRALGCPIMVGHSRKSMFERVGCPSGGRLPPTLAVTAMAAERGADVVRVHDVEENAAVIRTVAETTGF